MWCNYTKPLENKINVLDFLKGLHFALYAALLVCPCNVTRYKDSLIIYDNPIGLQIMTQKLIMPTSLVFSIAKRKLGVY